jgi:hypothetical protein
MHYYRGMKPVFFIDKAYKTTGQHPLIATARAPFQSAQGHLRVDAVATVAKVLRYQTGTNTYIDVLRHPDEVFNDDSLATLGGIPVTVSHPYENGKHIAVTPENVGKYGVGVIGDSIIKNNPYVQVSLNIQDGKAQESIKKNPQLSPGYNAVIELEDGVFDGIKYQARQYGTLDKGIIEYNHLAIMDSFESGRNGNDAVILIPDSISDAKVTNKKYPSLKYTEQYGTLDKGIIEYNHLAIMDSFESGRNGNDAVILIPDSISDIQIPMFLDTGYGFEEEKPKKFYIDSRKNKSMRSINATIHDGKNSINYSYIVDAEGDTVTIPVAEFQKIIDLNNEQFSMLISYQEDVENVLPSTEELVGDSSNSKLKRFADTYKVVKAERDAFETQFNDNESKIEAEVQKRLDLEKQRLQLVDTAKSLISDSATVAKLPQMSDRDIRLSILSMVDSSTDYASMDDLAVLGASNVAIKVLTVDSANLQRNAEKITQIVDGATPTDPRSQIQKNIKNARKR